MGNKNRRPETVRCACGQDIPVGRRGPLPQQCKTCRNRGNTVVAALRRRERSEERGFLESQALRLENMIRDFRALQRGLAPLPEWLAAEASSLARKLEAVLAETRARESALAERKRVLEQRWEEAQKRRYTAKRGS